MEENRKQFPTPQMIEAEKRLAQMTPEERKAKEDAMRVELEKYYKGRPPIELLIELLGEE